MSTKRDNRDSEVLREFLTSPFNQRNFHEFYLLCQRITINGLLYRKSKGYQLPLDHRLDKAPLKDLAIDILGALLASEKGNRFHVVFEHFRRRGGADFLQRDDEWLYANLRALILSFISQELSRIRDDTNHQTELLKRRIKECLSSDIYESVNVSKHVEFVFIKKSVDNMRSGCPVIPSERLIELVRMAGNVSKNTCECCLTVFRQVSELTEYRDGVYLHDLLTAMVIVISEMVELEGCSTSSVPDPESDLISREMARVCEQAIEHVRKHEAQRYMEQGRLSCHETDRLVAACKAYLDDWSNCSGPDKLPVYFREALPEVPYRRYLSHYKYLFDSMIGAAVQYVRESQKFFPTKGGDRVY